MEFDKVYFRANSYIGYINLEDYVSVNITFNETALCVNGDFYILNGDHRMPLRKLNKFTDVKEYFLSNEDDISVQSNNFDILRDISR